MLKNLKIVKIAVGACVFMALFFAYQIPFGYVQRMFKIAFLGLSIFLVFIILNFKSESKNKWLNLALIATLGFTAFLYLFETE
jgi:hypothetical protein